MQEYTYRYRIYNRSARITFALACASVLLLFLIASIGFIVVWRRFSARKALDDLRAEALSSPANGLVTTADEVYATEMYVDLDGALRSDATMPLVAPSLSPDCQFLAYMDPTQGSGDLFLLNLKDKTTRLLVGTPAYENEPYFSNRGDKVFFMRVDAVGRHIFSIDLKSGLEVQITHGKSIDRVEDVIDDATLVLYREPAQQGDTDVPAAFYEIDVTKNVPKEKLLSEYPHYALNGRYLVYAPEDDDEGVWVEDRQTGIRRRVGSGTIFRTLASKAAVLVSHTPRGLTQGPNYPLGVIDLETGQEHSIGNGHTSIFLSDNLVFFAQGYKCKCFVHNLATGATTPLSIPEGHLAVPGLSKQCRKATLSIQYPNSEKVWHLGIMDVDSLKYEEVLRIDMAKIRATPADKARALKAGPQTLRNP